MNARDHALVVGVNDYPRFGRKGRNLRGAIRDAQSVHAWLTEANTGGAVPPEQCELVLSSADPLTPIQDMVDDALDRIWDRVKEGGGRRFYFYFSGHGLARETNDVAMCMADWTERRDATLSSRGYTEFMKRCMGFTEVFAWLDCCRSPTGIARPKGPVTHCEGRPGPTAGTCDHFTAYAAEFYNAAFEAERGTSPQAPVVHGHFTTALLAGLRRGSSSAKGGVTPAELQDFLSAEVPRIAKERGHIQRPTFETTFPPGADVLLGSARREAAPSRRVMVRLKEPRVRVSLRTGQDQLVREGPAPDTWDLELSPGLYVITDEETQVSTAMRVRVDPEVMSVEF